MNRWLFAAVTLLVLVSITVFCVLGCASKPEPSPSPGVAYYTDANGVLWACAPGPQVVP